MEPQRRAAKREETAQDCRRAIDRLIELDLGYLAHKLALALWLRGAHHRQIDAKACDVAAWIKSAKNCRVDEAFGELIQRKVAGYTKKVRGGYWGIWIVDLQSVGADPEGPRREACHLDGQRELPGEPWDDYRNPQEQMAQPAETLPIALAADAPRGPESLHEACKEGRPVESVESRIGRMARSDLPSHPPPEAPELVPKNGQKAPEMGTKNGASATTTSTSNVDTYHTSTSKEVLSDVNSRNYQKTSTQRSSIQAPEMGAKNGACFAAAAERLSATPSLLTVEGLVAEFPAAPTPEYPNAPADWAESAAIVIAEALTGGRGFDGDVLFECIQATRTKRSAGTLTGPAWCFFRSACQRKYKRFCIRWPKFETKPKPR